MPSVDNFDMLQSCYQQCSYHGIHLVQHRHKITICNDNSESTMSVPITVIPQLQIPPVPAYEADNKPQSLQVHYPNIMLSLNVHSGAHQIDIYTKSEKW